MMTQKTTNPHHAGRRMKYEGMKIIRVAEENPRRPGTHGFKSFEIIRKRKELTFEKYLALGGRTRDLDWDVKHGYVTVIQKH